MRIKSVTNPKKLTSLLSIFFEYMNKLETLETFLFLKNIYSAIFKLDKISTDFAPVVNVFIFFINSFSFLTLLENI